MLTQVVLQCFYSDHDVWCGAAISRHMWSDQRLLISRDSEGGSEDLKRLFSLTWQWDQRPESASEPWPCATGQVRGKEEASGDAEAAACESLPPPETPPGAGRLPEVGSGNFLQESQKSWSIILSKYYPEVDLVTA